VRRPVERDAGREAFIYMQPAVNSIMNGRDICGEPTAGFVGTRLRPPLRLLELTTAGSGVVSFRVFFRVKYPCLRCLFDFSRCP
jgi:hypothetical protein